MANTRFFSEPKLKDKLSFAEVQRLAQIIIEAIHMAGHINNLTQEQIAGLMRVVHAQAMDNQVVPRIR